MIKTKVIAVTLLITITVTNLNVFLKKDVSLNLASASSFEKKFLVSAYYSPLPGQKYYMTGDLAGDLRLNGGGVNGASGSSVRVGMIAAPSKYPFGTKIELKGLGIGEVLDRGGAIVEAGNRGHVYDRLDIWMGYGELGLKRAIIWGKRVVEANVLGVNSKIKDTLSIEHLVPYAGENFLSLLKFEGPLRKGDSGIQVDILHTMLRDLGWIRSNFDSPRITLETMGALTKFLKHKNLYWTKASYIDLHVIDELIMSWVRFEQNPDSVSGVILEKFDIKSGLGRNAKGDDVIKLQDVLSKLGYPLNKTGVYDNQTIDAVFSFQVDHGIIKNDKDNAAGFFGLKTKKALLDMYFDLASVKEEVLRVSKEESRKNIISILQSDDLKWKGKMGERSGGVYTLQQFLKMLGFFPEKPTGLFGSVTRNAIIDFQINKGIIKNKNSEGAGNIGPTTTKVLWESVTDYLISNYLPSEIMSQGERGESVEILQKGLGFLGWYQDASNGIYGDKTKQAVADFQVSMGILDGPEDKGYGVFGPFTKESYELAFLFYPGVYLGLPNEWCKAEICE